MNGHESITQASDATSTSPVKAHCFDRKREIALKSVQKKPKIKNFACPCNELSTTD
jgi:hypothetical protein